MRPDRRGGRPRQCQPHHCQRGSLGLPKTYVESVRLLVEAGILPSDRGADFERMVRFRIRAVHLYDEIDPSEVFAIMEQNLGDFEAFIQAIIQRYFSGETRSDSEAGP